ncbi:LANO_0D01794g1_1 [Lachancea nothofagi CBS 11611]|uniref:Sm protein B n=1 Tax=Lachancea nothofagi CBS 11611 TaxID=1266666 RepID=A0A1G4JEB7_9SACH|nr:LANO_0D01794g1_1 [Lachancea nothofagi CBS 11611]
MSVKVSHKSKLSDLLRYRIRVLTNDGIAFVGELMAFDAHMNLVLAECVEHRIPATQMSQLKSKNKDLNAQPKIETRTLGLVVLRGDQVLTTVVESGPTMSKKERALVQEKKIAQLNKQKRKGKGIIKPVSGNNGPAGVSKPGAGSKPVVGFQKGSQPQPRPFQPPPGFKRR